MPKASGWLATALTVQGDSDGFFGATGGLELRAPRGITPRLTAAFGVGGHGFVGSGPHGEGGPGPYGESTLGLDVPIGGRMALTIAGGGMLRLDGDEFHGRAMALAGVVWK